MKLYPSSGWTIRELKLNMLRYCLSTGNDTMIYNKHLFLLKVSYANSFMILSKFYKSRRSYGNVCTFLKSVVL
jgi:hypothetical protein